MQDYSGYVKLLREKDQDAAYEAFLHLRAESRASDRVYPYLADFFTLLDAPSAYLRTRGLLLICANARWDGEDFIGPRLDAVLCHIQDEKPTVARQLIQALPELAQAKPPCVPAIRRALEQADLGACRASMRPLLELDIQATLGALE